MSGSDGPGLGDRVLVLAPTARDAETSQKILTKAGIESVVCRSMAEVCAAIDRGSGAALLTQEAILSDLTGCLTETLARQPHWSDFPLVVLTPSGANPPRAARALEAIGPMTLLKRPVSIAELVSTIRAALRDRLRQYRTRELMAEREEQAGALREANEQLAFVLEAGNLGSWQLDLDTGTIAASPLCKASFGLPPEADLSREMLLALAHPDDRDRVDRDIARSLDEHAEYDIESRTVWPDGSTHSVMVRGRADFDGRGTPVRMAGVSLDITDRKQAEDALRESERTFRFLAESMPQGVFTATAGGSIDYVNQVLADYVGRSVEVALDTSWTELVHPEDLETTRERWSESIATGRAFEVEHRVRRADGVYRWFLVRALPMKGADDRVLRWFGTSTDVEDMKQANKALQDADLRKDEFLAMLAHELRNPLAAVNNAVTVLKLSDVAENREWASDVVERQVKQLSRLIDDLLDVSRIRSGKIRLRRELVDAGPILAQAVELTRPLIEERRHRLTVAVDHGVLPVDADPIRLEQIAVNLLTNAAKYTDAGGRIWLTARREGGDIAIRVRDDGIGIPPDKLPEMFQLFAQGERSIARSEGGLGIGLTIVQRLAEMHGGSVSATSQGFGWGSEFTILIPAASPARAAESVASAPTRGAARGTRILVIDDNVDTARGMARLLKLLGNDVRFAHDGPSGVEIGRAFLPDFVLLDIGLPGMDGYQVAETLRSDGRLRQVVIIAISGYGQEEDRRRSKAAGFDHHLVKPVDHDALLVLLSRTH